MNLTSYDLPHLSHFSQLSKTSYSTSKKKTIRSYPVRIVRPPSSSKSCERDIKRTGEKKSQPVRVTELLGLQSTKAVQQHSIKTQSRRRAEPERLKVVFSASVAKNADTTHDKCVRRVLQYDEEDTKDTRLQRIQESGNPSDRHLRERKEQNAENRYSRIPTRMSSKKSVQNSAVVQRPVIVQKENKKIAQNRYQLRPTSVRKFVNTSSSMRRESHKNVKRPPKNYSTISQKGMAEKLKKEATIKRPTSRVDTGISRIQPSLEALLSRLERISNDQEPCSCEWALIASSVRNMHKKPTKSKTKSDSLPTDRNAAYFELQAGLQRVLRTMEENTATVKEILARITDALTPSVPEQPHSVSEPASNAASERATVPCEKEAECKELEQQVQTPMQTD